MHGGGIIDKLIKAAGNKIGKLHFRNGLHPDERCTGRGSQNCGFRKDRIDNTIAPKMIKKSFCHFKRAAVLADVLTKEKHRRIALHLFPKSLADSFDICDDRHER